MFGIGLAEIAIILVVALLVLGPKQLPEAARLAGVTIRKARTFWKDITDSLDEGTSK